MHLVDNPAGRYRFLTGIAPYSAGVVAMEGFEIVHAVLQEWVPIRDGFDRVEKHMKAEGLSRAALCAMELRIPAPLSFQGFADFNADYQKVLAGLGLILDGRNPVARTNISPAVGPPREPSLHAFSYVVERSAPPTFIVAGAGDLSDQAKLSPDFIVRPGETSVEALREKATVVMDVMEARLKGLERDWSEVSALDIYTVHPIQPFLQEAVLNRIGRATDHGVHWTLSRPPIEGLEFEMDLRGVRREIRL